MKKLYFDILDRKRQKLLPRLEFLRKDYFFYLAGGTALALQIRHRKSIDFDFYSPRDFSPESLLRRLKRAFNAVSTLHTGEGTLMASIQNVGMSFFRL